MGTVERLKEQLVADDEFVNDLQAMDVAKLLAAFEAVRAEANLMRHAITLSDSSLDEERENIAQKQRDTDAALRKLEGE